MTSDVFDGYRYDKTDTVSSCVIVKGSLLDYADLVRREGGKTQIQSTFVIDMDAVKDSLRIIPTPSSMDVVFIISKISTYREKLYETKKKHSKYLFADLKFNVTSPAKVDKNISNDSIKEKIKFTTEYIRSKDPKIPCCDVSYFVFKNANFEQVKNCWSRRNLNSPKNKAIKQVDFENLF